MASILATDQQQRSVDELAVHLWERAEQIGETLKGIETSIPIASRLSHEVEFEALRIQLDHLRTISTQLSVI